VIIRDDLTDDSTISAAASGTWQLGDLEVNRIGFGAMRLTQNGEALVADATRERPWPGDQRAAPRR